MTTAKFHSADGAEKRYNDNAGRDHVLMSATFTVRAYINVTGYADEYGETVEDTDPLTHVHDLLIEAIPEHLKDCVHIEVREDSHTGPSPVTPAHIDRKGRPE